MEDKISGASTRLGTYQNFSKQCSIGQHEEGKRGSLKLANYTMEIRRGEKDTKNGLNVLKDRCC